MKEVVGPYACPDEHHAERLQQLLLLEVMGQQLLPWGTVQVNVVAILSQMMLYRVMCSKLLC